MIEKSFNKAYSPTAPQSTFTRVANRLVKEYIAANGGFCDLPDEIKTIVEQIKACKETENYEYEYKYKSRSYDGVYDTVQYTNENRIFAFWDKDEYGDDVYRVTWYFFASEWYTKHINGKKLTAGNYHDILCKATAAKGKYRYFCTHRPPSRGVIPEGFVSYDTYSQNMRYIGEVTYNEKPSENELYAWGLVFDPDWALIHETYGKEKNNEVNK